jgi:anti-sigma B factor antagonist
MAEKVSVEIALQEGVAVAVFKAASLSSPEEIAAISKQVGKFIEDNHPCYLVFDFGEVKFFSSQVLGILLDIRGRIKSYSGEVVISSINPQLYRVFKITNLDKIFRFFPDKQSAIRAAGTN